MPVVAQSTLCLFVLGKHHQSGSVSVQTMYNVHSVLTSGTLHIFIKYGIGCALFLTFRIDGQKSLHLFDHNDICVFVHNFQQSVIKFFPSFIFADLNFHSRFQRKVELRGYYIIYQYHSFAEQ